MTGSFRSANWHRVAGLRPRLRQHVRVQRQIVRGTAWYVVADELSGQQHRFTPPVYLLAGLLDGTRTVDQAWRQVVERLAEAAPSQDETISALAQLHAADLLQSDVPPVVEELLTRRERLVRSERWQRYGNPLSIKLALFDPDRWLGQLVHLIGPLFGPGGLVLWLAVVLPALLLVAMHWAVLSHDVTDRILAGESLLAIAAVVPVTKLLHELGHGFAVKRWGGAVHELGLMLLVLFPLPYVDASAASAFRGKWSRVTVGAAGMLVELFLAALAVPVWLNTQPGPVRSVAYAVMVTAGLGTVLFNANPLMRLDGYYILGDLIEMPNLAGRSALFWRRLVARRLFGLKVPAGRPPASGFGEVMWCALYLPLSFAYRLALMVGVGAFVARRFFFIGMAIVLWGIATTLVWPLCKGLWYLLTAPELGEGQRGRACACAGALGLAVIAALWLLPFPLQSGAEGVVWLPDSSIVRAGEDGVVTRLAAVPGQTIAKGAPVAVLDDPELTLTLPLLRAQLAGAQARLAADQVDDKVRAALSAEALALRRDTLAHALDHLQRLIVRADTDGTLVVPHADDLAGRFVKRGEVLGFVTPHGSNIVRVAVAQGDVDLVRHRLRGVALMLPGAPVAFRTARLVREVPGGADRLPSSALGTGGGGGLATDPRDPSRTLTLQRSFQFDLELDGPVGEYGRRVLVRFDHGYRPLGAVLYRRLRQIVLSRFDA